MRDPRSTPAIAAHPKVDPLPALTTLRFFAAAFVVIYHYAPIYFPGAEPPVIPLGYTGVTFFFLLSGFILAYNYRDADLATPRRRSLFYRARFARIYPVLLLSLVIHLPWLFSWASMQPPLLKALMQSGTVLAPLGIHAWVPGAACSLNCPSWSVSVEVLFYALFPILLPLVLRDPSRVATSTLAVWLATVAVSTLAWRTFGNGASLIGPEPGGMVPVLLAEFIKYFPLMHLPTFVAGLLLFAAWQRHGWSQPVMLCTALACGAWLVLMAPFIPDVLLHNGLTVLVWAPLILACALMRGGPLCAAPLVFLGKISFALYLVHIPIYAAINTIDRVVLHGWLLGHPWTAMAVNGGASLVGATLVHLVVEEPARRWIMRRPDRTLQTPATA